MKYIFVVCLLFSLTLNLGLAKNILYFDHCGSPSHHIWNRALAYNLVKKGHNVTILSHSNEKTPPKNYHTILLEDVYKKLEDFDLEHVSQLSDYEEVEVVYAWSYKICKLDLATEGLKTLMSYPNDFKFDLIIFDVTAGQCLYPVIDKFKKNHSPPVIGVTPFLLPPSISHAFGNPLQPSYFPTFITKYGDKMSFLERLRNFYLIYADALYRKYIALPNEEELARKHFGNTFRPFEEIERDIGLLLANTDPNLVSPLDLPPNIIPVGGLQITPAKPLPKDLEKIVNESTDGVILFTLGSNLRSDNLSEKKRRSLLNAFSKLSQTILWKFESEKLDGLPKNVIIRKWLPQNDILGHPKTKLFITHGGGLGTQETMYHGVPAISIPFFIDHIANSERFVRRKLGKSLNFKNIETENLEELIKEVINNPIYRNNIQALSKKYRDQPQTPLERATFWVEYVMRHGTAEHLNLAARDMSAFQIYNYDVIIFLLFLSFLLYVFVTLTFTFIKFIVSLSVFKKKK